MKKVTLSYILLLAVIVSACGAPANTTPTLDSVSVQNTALAAAFTLIAGTQAALPTNTALPPTDAFTQTPLPTDTLAPSPTLDALVTPTVILLPTDLPTFTPQPAATGSDPCNQPLLKWQGPSSNFAVVNETKPKGTIILFMSVSTTMGECGWLNITGTNFSGPVGSYSAGAFVEGPKNFKVFGAFNINGGSWKIIVRNEGIVAKGGCYPNC
mgnify:FL=1